VRVRPARLEDAAAIAEVHVLTWQAAYEHVFGAEQLAALHVDERRARWEERLAAPEPHWRPFVAEDENGRLVGFASAGACRDAEGEGQGELHAIYVLPDAWGAGAGPALMRGVVDALRGEGFGAAILWVLEDNPRARRFYERQGWIADGARREGEYLGVATAEVRYRIEL
jgi:L-amino acid N-acyltransferase YncA